MSPPPESLLACLSPERSARFLAAAGGDARRAWNLHVFNAEVSSLFRDAGIVEIALRNAMSSALARDFGASWFRRAELFDDSTRQSITMAWERQLLERCPAGEQGGRLVAGLTFGF